MCLYLTRWIVLFLTCVNRCSSSTSSIPDSSTTLQLHELSTTTFTATVSGISSASFIITLPVSDVTTDSLLISPSKTLLLTTESAKELSLRTTETSSSVHSGLLITMSSAELSSTGNTDLSPQHVQSSTGISSNSFESSSGYSSRISATKGTAEMSTSSVSHSLTQTTEMNSHSVAQTTEMNIHSVTQATEMNSHSVTQTTEMNSHSVTQTTETNSHSVTQTTEMNSHSVTQTTEMNSHSVTQTTEMNIQASTSELQGHHTEQTSTVSAGYIVTASTETFKRSSLNLESSSGSMTITDMHSSTGISTSIIHPSSSQPNLSSSNVMTSVEMGTNTYFTSSANAKTNYTLALTTTSETSVGMSTNSYLTSNANAKTSNTLSLMTTSEIISTLEASFLSVDKSKTDLSEVSTTRLVSVPSTSNPITISPSVVEHSTSVTSTEKLDHETSSSLISSTQTFKLAFSSSTFVTTSRDSNTLIVQFTPTTIVHLEPSSTFVSVSKEVLKTISDSTTTYVLKSTPFQVNTTSAVISSLQSSGVDTSTTYVLKSTPFQINTTSTVISSLQSGSAETSITYVLKSIPFQVNTTSTVISSLQPNSAETSTTYVLKSTSFPLYSSSAVIGSLQFTTVETSVISTVQQSLDLTSLHTTLSVSSSKQLSTFSHSESSLADQTTSSAIPSTNSPAYILSPSVTSVDSSPISVNSSVRISATAVTASSTTKSREETTSELMTSFSTVTSMKSAHFLLTSLSATESQSEITSITRYSSQTSLESSSFSFYDVSESLSKVHVLSNTLSTFIEETASTATLLGSETVTSSSSFTELTSAPGMVSRILSLSTYPPLTTSVDLPFSTDNSRITTSSAEYLTTLSLSIDTLASSDTLGVSTSSVEYLTIFSLSTHAPFKTSVDNSLSLNTLIESTTSDEYLTHLSDSSQIANLSIYSNLFTSSLDTLRTISTVSDMKSESQIDFESFSILSMISNSNTGSTGPVMTTSVHSTQHPYLSTGIFASISASIETSFTSLESVHYTSVSSNVSSIHDLSRQSTSTTNTIIKQSSTLPTTLTMNMSSTRYESTSGIVIPTLPVASLSTTTKEEAFESLTTFLSPSTATYLPHTSITSSDKDTTNNGKASTTASYGTVLHTTTPVINDSSLSSHLLDISPTPSLSDVNEISNTTQLYSLSSFEALTNTIFSLFTSPFYTTTMTSQELIENTTSHVIVFPTQTQNLTSIWSSTVINVSVSEPNSSYVKGLTTKHSSDISMITVSTNEYTVIETHISSSSMLITELVESSSSSHFNSSVETLITRHERSFDSTFSFLDSSLSHLVTSSAPSLIFSAYVTNMSSDYKISPTPTINIDNSTPSIVPTSSNLSLTLDMHSSFLLETSTTPKYSKSSFQTETNLTTNIEISDTKSDLFTLPIIVHPTSTINITSASITMTKSPLHNDTTLVETSSLVLKSSTRTFVTSVTQGEFSLSANTIVEASKTLEHVSTSINVSEFSTRGIITSNQTATIISSRHMPNTSLQSVIHTVVNATSSFMFSTSIIPSSVNHTMGTDMVVSSSLAAKPTFLTSGSFENSTFSTPRSLENQSLYANSSSTIEKTTVATMTTLASPVTVKSTSTREFPITLIYHTTVISTTIAISSTTVLSLSEVISPSKAFSPTASQRSSLSSMELTTSEKYTFSTVNSSTFLPATSIFKTSTSAVPTMSEVSASSDIIPPTSVVPNITVSNAATSVSENPIIPSRTSDVSTPTSVTLTTSIVAPSTSTPVVPPTTILNATNAKETYWIRTVLKVQKTLDVSNRDFMRTTEEGLANAYNEAFIRERLIAEAKFEPLHKRRRKKRYTTVGDASIHVSDINRVGDSNSVNVVYAVEKAGQVLTAEQAVKSLAVLDTQELAIILKQVVDVRAETYVQSEKIVQPVKSGLDLWLIGVIAGSVGGFIIFVFIVVCIYCKCCRHQETQDSGEVELTSIHPQSSQRKMSRQLPSPPPKKPLVSQGSKFSLKNRNTYKLTTPEITEVVPDERTFLTTSAARKKGLQSPKSSFDASCENTPTLPRRELAPPTVKKARRNSRNSIGPSIEEMSAGSSMLQTSKTDPSQLFKSNVSEDSEDVNEQLKLEKKKNKERLREMYAHELEPEVEDDDVTARKEIILGMSETAVPNVVIESGSPVKEPTNPSRRQSTVGNVPGEENLEEARTRMHKLLDDAFSLISPRNSFTENDLSAVRQLKEYAARKTSEHSSTQSIGEMMDSTKSDRKPLTADRVRDLLSGFTNPGYTSSYSNFLETWSPYRASDQVAHIAMPNKLEPEVTKLGNKSHSSTSRQKGRPATNLELVNSKSTSQIDGKRRPERVQESTFTTEAPKPIVLKTKDETPSARLDSAKSVGSLHSNQNRMFSNKSSAKDLIQNGNATTIQNGNAMTISSHVQAVNSLLRGTRETQEPTNETHSAWKHREPEKHITIKDEVDVIQNIRPEEKTDNLIKSLKDELKSIKADSEVDINKKPLKRKNRKHHSKPMTDIV